MDRASYGGVVYLSRVDVHSCVASSALLALAPEVREAAGFSADGWLSQEAHHVVRRIALDSVTPTQRRAAQNVCLKHAASLGIGMVHELGGPEISSAEDFADLLAVVGPESGVEVVGYWGEGGGPDVAVSLGARGAAGDHFVDGAIGSRTAFLRDRYADSDTHGAAYTTAATIRDHVIACSRAGVQAGYHVIGDGAMDLVVAGFTEAAEAVGDDVVRASQHRLEHVEMVDEQARSLAGSARCAGQRSAGLRRMVGWRLRHVHRTTGERSGSNAQPIRHDAGRRNPVGLRLGRPGDTAGPVAGDQGCGSSSPTS